MPLLLGRCYNPFMTDVTLASDVTDLVGAVVAIAGVAVSLAGIVYGWRAAVPQRKVAYSFDVTPLLNGRAGNVDDVMVYRGTERLAHPHTATLKLVNVGNREIEAAHFNGAPVEFSLNARVIAELDRETGDNRRIPPMETNGSALYVQPFVIHKGQEIAYKLLLDGPSPAAQPRHSLSAELRVDHRFAKSLAGWALVILVALGAMFVWADWQIDKQRSSQRADIQEAVNKAYLQGKADAERLHRLATASPSATRAPDSVGSPPTSVGGPP